MTPAPSRRSGAAAPACCPAPLPACHATVAAKRVLLTLLWASTLGGCGRQATLTADEAPGALPGARAPVETSVGRQGVHLSPDDIVKLGIVVEPATAIRYRTQIAGFAVVVGRDLITQALAEVAAARAATHQSQAALARMQRLAGTPGADSAVARDSAQRQAATDLAALDEAEAKASSVLGRASPWLGQGTALSRQLAAGRIAVVRVSFALGNFLTGTPQELRIMRLDGPPGDSLGHVTTVWPAPADPSLPGRSYYAVVERSDLAEGERLLAWATDAPTAAGEPGAFIPASALVISAGRYWCYVREGGLYVRTRVDIDHPQPGGYFIGAGIAPGAAIVTAGAGLLLARDTGSTD